MGGWKPDSSEEAQWEKLARFVQLYSWLTIGGVLFGVALAHKVLFTGQSWTTCAGKVGCVLTFHLMEVPLVVYLVVVAISGLGYLSRATLHRFYALWAAHLGIMTPLPSLAARSSSGVQH
jgi:sterol desaturase/sphingolipid hydroxylase (fatty acid hydroxylase superfamily)